MSFDSIPLIGGLDLVRHEQNSRSGTLRKCSNFERSVVDGYSKIDGYHAIDGVVNDVQLTYMRTQTIRAVYGGFPVVVPPPDPATEPTYTVGDNYTINGVPVVCVYAEIDQQSANFNTYDVEQNVFVSIAERIVPAVTDAVITIDLGASTETPGSFKLIDSTEDFWEPILYTALTAAIDVLESDWIAQATSPPGQGQVYGLHFFKNQQYAIREYRAFVVLSDEFLPDAGLTPINGDIISNASGTWWAEVIKAFPDGNIWGKAGDECRIIIHNERGTLYVGDDIGYPGSFAGMLLTGYPMGIAPLGADIMEGFESFSELSEEDAESEGGLYVATSNGWVEVDMLREVPFRTGTIEPDQAVRLAKAIDATAATATTGTTATATDITRGWYASGGSAIFTNDKATDLASLATISDVDYMQFDTSTAALSIVSMKLKGFDFSEIPDSATILGVEVLARQMGTVSTSTNNIKEERVRLVGIGSSNIKTNIVSGGDNMTAPTRCTAQDKADTASLLASAFASRTFGGLKDLWGEASINASQLRDPNVFGVWLEYRCTNGGGNPDLRMSYLRITVYYQKEDGRTFAINATGTAVPTELRVINVCKTSGAWDAGTAAGIMTVICDKDVDKDRLLADGDIVWENANGTGDQYVILAGPDYPVTMPGRDQMDAASKQFEFINENFYQSARWLAFYGVSGVGPAFCYDGTYFIRIRTELLADTPCAIGRHHTMLALGFDDGIVTFSALGDPLSFAASDDAFIREFGDPVTNLAKMVADTIGVFCRSSIHAGMGTDLTLQTRVISPDTGAFPHTVRNVSGRTVGVDNWGLFVVDTTDRFGDFVNGRLSKDISPFIVKRTQERGQFPQLRPRFSYLCRAKNQHRTVFGDERVVTATFTPGGVVEFSFMDLPQAPLCASSQIDAQGRERMAMSLEHEDLLASYLEEAVVVGDIVIISPPKGQVYAVDSGHTFNGDAIAGYVELPFNDNGGTLIKKKGEYLSVYGQSEGSAEVTVSHAVDNGRMVSFGVHHFNPVLIETNDEEAGDLVPASMVIAAQSDFFAHAYRFSVNGKRKVAFQYMIDNNTGVAKSQGNVERSP